MRYISLIQMVVLSFLAISLQAQDYPKNLLDKTVIIVGNEMVTLSQIEQELQYMRANGMYSEENARCQLVEKLLDSKLLLSQSRLDSLKINHDYVNAMLTNKVNEVKQALGGEEKVAKYFGKPLYKLRLDWKETLEDQSLTQQMQQKIINNIPDLSPDDVKKYISTLDKEDIPKVPIKYQFSQICVYPNKERAKLEAKNKLLKLRERIINGESFATLARLYSEDYGSAIRGGELGLTPKANFWPVFSDAAMALKPGMISQIVETPDGLHLIKVIEKKGDMFNARHILIKPKYTIEDEKEGFAKLDSIKTAILDGKISFEDAAMYYSEDMSTKANCGLVAEPQTGASFFEVNQIYPAEDYQTIKELGIGDISKPIKSLDREGRNGNTVYKIIRLDKVIPAHECDFSSDYPQLLNATKQHLQEKALNDFINNKIKDTYVYIDPIFKGCTFNREGWNKKNQSKNN